MENEELNLTHRCDACNAHAKVRVSMKTGTLDFCGHHYNKYAENLKKQGAEVLINQMESNGENKVLVDA